MADITRWDPFADLFNFRTGIDRIFDQLTPPRLRGINREIELTFPVDVYENKDEIVVKALLPGVKPSDIDISVDDNILTLRGQMREESESEEQNYYRREVMAGSFLRQITLPSEVVADKAEATFEDGVLRLRMPRAERSRARSIKVQARQTLEGRQGQQLGEGKGAPPVGKGAQNVQAEGERQGRTQGGR
jgi:HSP20 family protein